VPSNKRPAARGSFGIPIIWAITALVLPNGLKIQLSPAVHHWLFIYAMWFVPIAW